MRRLPIAAFAVLVVATIAAFFLVDALKVESPRIIIEASPTPAAFNPSGGRAHACISRTGQPLDYRQTELTFSPSHADSVGVYMVSEANASGGSVATVTSGRQMAKGQIGNFIWDGRLADGRIASPGTYFFRIVLQHEGSSIDLSEYPVQVIRRFPTPRILSVTLVHAAGHTAKRASAAAAPVLSPPHGVVKIRFTKAVYRRVWINAYRTDVAGKPRLADHFAVNPNGDTATWNGEIGGTPAPAGTYLIGITAQDAACDQSTYPVVLPPSAGTTKDSGVTVRYLTVRPQLTPAYAGSKATVAVYSPASGFTWKLRDTVTGKVRAHGTGAEGDTRLSVRLPKGAAGIYSLVVDASGRVARVPLVAAASGRAGDRARVLVVLPMLNWIGESEVDDNGDGLPDTLSAGDAVSLDRPLVFGRSGEGADDMTVIRDDVALVKYLASQHLGYQLTTDVALAEQAGPSLVDRWGVLLPDGSYYLPASLRTTLVDFVKYGGRVLALGTGSLAGTSQITGYPSDPRAAAPMRTRTDIFGAQRGPVASTGGELIAELTDQLKLFGEVVAFTGFSHYQPIEPPPGVPVSAAGIADRSAAIVAFTDGSGRVVEVGLPNFGASLAGNVDSQELMSSVWPLLAKQR